MDNSVRSRIKRALKVTGDYFISLVIFQVLFVPFVSIAKDKVADATPILSFVVFLFLFYLLYVDMRVMAFKEKRPQYNINPSPYKGLLYGGIGVIPLILIQIFILFIKFPEKFVTASRRLVQAFYAPLYWFAKLIGNKPIHYILSACLVVLIAGLGYFAGHKDFLITQFIIRKLGMEQAVKKKTNKPPKFR